MLGFWPSDAVLVTVQAAAVCLPRQPLPRALDAVLRRLAASAWAAVLPVSLGGTIALLAVAPGSVDAYTWLALIAVPVLAAMAIGRPGRRWSAVVLAALLFVIAWRAHGLLADGAAVALTTLSAIALGSVVARLAAPWVLKVGIVLMAALDAVLVFGQLLEGPNDHLNAAVPAPGLPQLQVAVFGSVLVGYGDLFIAAVLGSVLVRQGARRERRLAVAAVTLLVSAAFDLLFLVVDVLPATVPVALAMLVFEARDRWSRRRARGQPAGVAPAATAVR